MNHIVGPFYIVIHYKHTCMTRNSVCGHCCAYLKMIIYACLQDPNGGLSLIFHNCTAIILTHFAVSVVNCHIFKFNVMISILKVSPPQCHCTKYFIGRCKLVQIYVYIFYAFVYDAMKNSTFKTGLKTILVT